MTAEPSSEILFSLNFPLGLVGFTALIISSGIITVAASTYFTTACQHVFERNGEQSPVGNGYTCQNEHIDLFRENLKTRPRLLKRLYWWCHSFAFALLIMHMIEEQFKNFETYITIKTFVNSYEISHSFIQALPLFSVFSILGYIAILIWKLFEAKLFVFEKISAS